MDALVNEFKQMIDTYIEKYTYFEKGKIMFECDYGELIFYKSNVKLKRLVLHGIYINPKYRNKGLCRNILNYIIDECSGKFDEFCVESVISKVLYMYLLRFKHNNKKFRNTEDGFIFTI